MTYKIGTVVEEDGYYICVPCGSKRYFKKGSRFSSCLSCVEKKDKKMFKRGLELWEKVQ